MTDFIRVSLRWDEAIDNGRSNSIRDWVLRKEIKDWLSENDYERGGRKYQWDIGRSKPHVPGIMNDSDWEVHFWFYDEELAMLFKLTWGGK